MEIQDPVHVLQNCPIYAPERIRPWPSWADFKDKLWGSTEDLRTTAQLIENINIPIRIVTKEHLKSQEEDSQRMYR